MLSFSPHLGKPTTFSVSNGFGPFSLSHVGGGGLVKARIPPRVREWCVVVCERELGIASDKRDAFAKQLW